MRDGVLSTRLTFVKTIAGTCGTVADIGTDHALLPVSMVAEGLAEKAILTDVRKGPLEAAVRGIEKYCPEKRSAFDLRHGNGLKVLKKGEADVITICGMGGLLIAEILEASPEVAKNCPKLVLQPNTCVGELRRFLWDNGFTIAREQGLAEAGHPYAIIETRYTGEKKPRGTGPVKEAVREYLGELMGIEPDRDDLKYFSLISKKAARVVAAIRNAGAETSERDAGRIEFYEAVIAETARITGGTL